MSDLQDFIEEALGEPPEWFDLLYYNYDDSKSMDPWLNANPSWQIVISFDEDGRQLRMGATDDWGYIEMNVLDEKTFYVTGSFSPRQIPRKWRNKYIHISRKDFQPIKFNKKIPYDKNKNN